MNTQTSNRQEMIFAAVSTLVGVGLWALLVTQLSARLLQPVLG